MFGIFLAALSSIILATADAGKKELAKSFSPFQVGWITLTSALICNTLFLYVSGGLVLPKVEYFYLVTFTCALAAVVGEVAFITAVTTSDFSLVIPISAFSPVFASLLSAIFLRELPSGYAVLGVVIVACGSYLLGLDSKPGQSKLAPVKLLFTKGPLCMLLSTSCFAVIATLQKFLSRDVDSILAFTAVMFVCAVSFTIVLLWKGKKLLEPVIARPALSLSMGVCWAVGMTMLYVSIGFTPMAVATSVSRLGMLYAVLLGYLFFDEKDISQRLLAGAVMILGVLLVIWNG